MGVLMMRALLLGEYIYIHIRASELWKLPYAPRRFEVTNSAAKFGGPRLRIRDLAWEGQNADVRGTGPTIIINTYLI